MKRTLTLFILTFIFTKSVLSQGITIITSDFLSPKEKIQSNIIFAGVYHDPDINTLLSDSSGKVFCSVFTEKVVAASQGKPIIFLVEGIPDGLSGYFNPYLGKKLGLPECLRYRFSFMGVENRPDSMKSKTVESIFNIAYWAYEDSIDGTESSLEACFKKPSTIAFDILDSAEIFRAKEVGKVNVQFETSILEKAKNLEKQGNYVVVLVGAVHAMKMAVKNPDLGYIFAADAPNELWSTVRGAKVLELLDHL